MRKYEHKESRNFAQILGMTNAVQVRQECAAKAFNRPLLLIKRKIEFYCFMMKLRKTLERGRGTDFFSKSDYIKLKEMWLSILKREYEPSR